MLFHYYEPRSELEGIARKLVTTKNTMHSERQHEPLSTNLGAIKKVVWFMQPIEKNFSSTSIPNWGNRVEIFKYRAMALTSMITWLLRPSVSSSLVTLMKKRNQFLRMCRSMMHRWPLSTAMKATFLWHLKAVHVLILALTGFHIKY